MGGMFAGLMSGYGDASRENSRQMMEIELSARDGIAKMWESIANNPDSPPEIRQGAMENLMGIYGADPTKPLPKPLMDINALARRNPVAPTEQASQMAGQTELPASIRGDEPPTPPQGLLNIPYGEMGAPGGAPMGPSPAPEGLPPMNLPTPEGADDSLFYSPGQMTDMQMDEIQRYLDMGLMPQGISRDIQEPLYLSPGEQAHQRDPTGELTGQVLQAPFKPEAGPQLSAEDQIAVNAYAVKNEMPIEDMGPEDYQQAISEGKEMMRRPEKDALKPVIHLDSQGNSVITFKRESDLENKTFLRPSGTEGLAAQAIQSAKMIYPRMKLLAVGMKPGEWGEPKDEGIFTAEGWQALPSGLYKSLAAKANIDVDMAEYLASLEGFIPIFARAVGHSGVLTELDSLKTMKLFPRPGDSRELAIRKMRNIEMLMEGKAVLAPDWWDPMGLALRPPPDPALQGLTNEELLGFMER